MRRALWTWDSGERCKLRRTELRMPSGLSCLTPNLVCRLYETAVLLNIFCSPNPCLSRVRGLLEHTKKSAVVFGKDGLLFVDQLNWSTNQCIFRIWILSKTINVFPVIFGSTSYSLFYSQSSYWGLLLLISIMLYTKNAFSRTCPLVYFINTRPLEKGNSRSVFHCQEIINWWCMWLE